MSTVQQPGSETEVLEFALDDDSDQQFGWLVDRVRSVESLRDPETEPVEDNELVSGVVSRDGQFTLWVDPERVNEKFSSRDRSPHSTV